jgi:hypothetical protein
MVVLMATTLALICFTSCWVLMKLDCFQVLAIGMGHDYEGTKMGWVGSDNLLKNDMYECDKGEEMNPM